MSQGLGAFLGSFVGLLAILIGALMNAWLTRRRDDHQTVWKRQALAVALRSELLLMQGRVAWRWKMFISAHQQGKKETARWNWTIQKRDIYEANRQQISILSTEIVEKVVDTYGMIQDYQNALELADREWAPQMWAANLMEKIFKRCLQTANSLARAEGLALPLVDKTIEQAAEEAFKELDFAELQRLGQRAE